MNLVDQKLSKLFDPTIKLEIAEVLEIEDSDIQRRFTFADGDYYINKITKTSLHFGYTIFNMFSDFDHFQPIAYILTEGTYLFPPFEKNNLGQKLILDPAIKSFSEKYRLLITLFSIDTFQELKLNIKNIHDGKSITMEAHNVIFSVSKYSNTHINFYINNGAEHVAHYDLSMENIGFAENYEIEGRYFKTTETILRFEQDKNRILKISKLASIC